MKYLFITIQIILFIFMQLEFTMKRRKACTIICEWNTIGVTKLGTIHVVSTIKCIRVSCKFTLFQSKIR
jgi:hypothetical protein